MPRLLAVLALLLAPALANAAATPWAENAKGSARLVTATDAAGSGPRLDAALQLRLAPGWHTYWRTPGDAGFPATIDWTGSSNLASAAIAWPAPRRLTIEGLENYVYEDAVTLPITLTLERPGQPLHVQAEVDYAACEKVCIPYHAVLKLDLPAGLALPGPEAPLIAAASAALPSSLAAQRLTLAAATVSSDALHVVIDGNAALKSPDLFVEGIPLTAPAAPQISHPTPRATAFAIPLPAKAAAAIANQPLSFTLTAGSQAAQFTTAPAVGLPPVASAAASLFAILGAALLGGLILNAMPCVLPVLSFKLLSVANYAGAQRREVRRGLLATAAGILASFLLLAIILAILKLGGAAIGWGIQFQQPWFLAAMAAAMTLFAASLLGLLSINLPGFALAAGALRPRHPLLDSFTAGAFATLLATSCSAPFVGTAVGFALARGPLEILLVFAALGLGMAAPLLAVAAAPGLVRLLPRPGPWMLVLRRLLGLALAGTAVWLLWVLAQVAGATTAAVTGLLLAAVLAALILRQRTPEARRPLGAAVTALVLAAVLLPAWATPPNAVPTPASPLWRPLDPAAIQREVAAGHTVFVDVTAAWCLTCKVNEAAVIDRNPVAARLRRPGTIAMRADWTRPEPAITAYLQRFGRYGVPLNVVFGPAAPDGRPLPELLTAAAVLAALDQAAAPGKQALNVCSAGQPCRRAAARIADAALISPPGSGPLQIKD